MTTNRVVVDASAFIELLGSPMPDLKRRLRTSSLIAPELIARDSEQPATAQPPVSRHQREGIRHRGSPARCTHRSSSTPTVD